MAGEITAQVPQGVGQDRREGLTLSKNGLHYIDG